MKSCNCISGYLFHTLFPIFIYYNQYINGLIVVNTPFHPCFTINAYSLSCKESLFTNLRTFQLSGLFTVAYVCISHVFVEIEIFLLLSPLNKTSHKRKKNEKSTDYANLIMAMWLAKSGLLPSWAHWNTLGTDFVTVKLHLY